MIKGELYFTVEQAKNPRLLHVFYSLEEAEEEAEMLAESNPYIRYLVCSYRQYLMQSSNLAFISRKVINEHIKELM